MAPPSPVVPTRARRHRVTTARASSSSSRTHARPPSRAVMHSSSRTMARRSASRKGGPRDVRARPRRRRRPFVRASGRTRLFIFSFHADGQIDTQKKITLRTVRTSHTHHVNLHASIHTYSTPCHPMNAKKNTKHRRRATPSTDNTAAPTEGVRRDVVEDAHRAAVCDDGDVTDGWCVRAREMVDARANDRLVRRLRRRRCARRDDEGRTDDAGRMIDRGDG